jgi:hypothetical protein
MRSEYAATEFKADGSIKRRSADLSRTEPKALNVADTFLSTVCHRIRESDGWTVSHSQWTRESTSRPMTTPDYPRLFRLKVSLSVY